MSFMDELDEEEEKVLLEYYPTWLDYYRKASSGGNEEVDIDLELVWD